MDLYVFYGWPNIVFLFDSVERKLVIVILAADLLHQPYIPYISYNSKITHIDHGCAMTKRHCCPASLQDIAQGWRRRALHPLSRTTHQYHAQNGGGGRSISSEYFSGVNQRAISSKIDLHNMHLLSEQTRESGNVRETARLNSLTIKNSHQGDFLNVVPNPGLNLLLHPVEFVTTLRYRLGPLPVLVGNNWGCNDRKLGVLRC